MEFAEYDDMLRRLLTVVLRMDDAIDELRAFNRTQVAINTRLETLLQRVLRSDDANGRDA